LNIKKILLISALIAIGGLAGLTVFKGVFGNNEAAAREVSEASSRSLESKMTAVKKANSASKGRHSGVDVFETELDSYVLYSLRKNMPVQLNSIDVKLTTGSISANADIAFAPSDSLFGGSHTVFIKGRLTGRNGRGKFDLDDVRLDGIPVPHFLMDVLLDRYVRTKYPGVDLKEPFDLPWGIEDLTIGQGKARVEY
jgi:hypothetical protein